MNNKVKGFLTEENESSDGSSQINLNITQNSHPRSSLRLQSDTKSHTITKKLFNK